MWVFRGCREGTGGYEGPEDEQVVVRVQRTNRWFMSSVEDRSVAHRW